MHKDISQIAICTDFDIHFCISPQQLKNKLKNISCTETDFFPGKIVTKMFKVAGINLILQLQYDLIFFLNCIFLKQS